MVLTQTNHYDSSLVKSSSYNFTHKTLTVHFTGATYIYNDVDPETHMKFVTADSQGSALNEFIKGNFEFTKIHEE